RLDAASMVLLEKLNKIEATIAEQGTSLGRIQEATSSLEPGFLQSTKLHQSPFCPTQPKMCIEAFEVPKGRWASLDYFMTLPFISTLVPPGRKFELLVFDNTEIAEECKLPNLHQRHVQKLLDHFLAEIHPLHPVM